MTTFDYQKNSIALEQFDSAKDLAEAGKRSLAIKSIIGAGQLFQEVGDRYRFLQTKSLELKWRYEISPQTFYEEHGKDVLAFLEDFIDQNSHPGYVITYYNYLKYQSIKFAGENDFINARDALNQLVELACNFRQPLSPIVTNNQIQIWRAQIKEFEAKTSHLRKDDLATRAQYYFDAAELSTPIDASDDLADKMTLHKHSLLSTYYKLIAFSLVRKQNRTFSAIVDNLRLSLEHAEKAYILSEDANRKKHKFYISYWFHIFSARSEMVKTHFDRATSHLNDAIESAAFLRDNRVNIFPNHYSDFEDLCNERLVVRAYNLLVQSEFEKSRFKLNKWLERGKNKTGTWRYNSIKLRFYAVQLFADIDEHFHGQGVRVSTPKYSSAGALQEKINDLMKEVGLGKSSERIAKLTLLLALDFERNTLTQENFQDYLRKTIELFPTDSVIEDYENIASISLINKHDPADLIPECFSREMDRISRSRNSETAVQALNNLLRCYTLILVEYHYLKYLNYVTSNRVNPLAKEFAQPLETMALDQLIEKLYDILDAINKNKNGLEFLRQYILTKKETEGIENISFLFKTAKEAITKSSIRFFPHIIRVNESPEDHVEGSYVCERTWKREFPKRLLFANDWPLSLGKYYYLKPRWKNFIFEKVSQYRLDTEIYESKLYKGIEENLLQQDEIERRENSRWKLNSYIENIKKLEKLIEENAIELEIQRFLTQNYWVFGLHFQEYLPEYKIDVGNIADFCLVGNKGERVIGEIKRPGVSLFKTDTLYSENSILEGGARVAPTHELNDAINRLEGYQIAYNNVAAMRHGNAHLHQVEGILLIGEVKSEQEKTRLQELKIKESRGRRKIITYSDLLSDAKSMIGNLQRHIDRIVSPS